MTLEAGVRLGPYEVISPLGSGGMGEVYRAKDTRLGRDVAVKVLPEHLSLDADLKARFEREAKAISQITHPHICTLHDVGNADGVEYLVMELLDGQTLAEKLEKGPLPMEQVLRYGVEIADALDKAHRAGIVHRDLKPGNVMITKSGVKLLDFGLAKAVGEAPADVGQLSSLPTEAERPLTERGTILGTFQYMSPEQLEGREADARSDIFAFGCVLYEMATAKKAFTGASRVSLISSIMRDDPRPISSIAPMTPPALDRVVRNCLAKDPEDRWQSAHDVMSELRWIAEAGSQAGAPAVIASKRKNRERLAWIVAGVAALAAVLLAAGYVRRSPLVSKPILAIIPQPENVSGTDFALSPDGSKLAFCAARIGANPGLWVRALSEASARPVAGAEDAILPFWSPDGKSIAFFGGGSLKRVAASGGPVLTVCEAESPKGGAWNADGTILFAPKSTSALYRVPAAGGTPIPVTKLDAALHVTTHRYPHFLPDGRHFLYMTANPSSPPSDPANAIRVSSLDGKLDKALVNVPSNASYMGGFLFYGRDSMVVAQAVDTSRWAVKGDPVTLGERLSGASWFGYSPFSVSEQELVYLPAFAPPTQLEWKDRNGRSLGPVGEPRSFLNVRLSPDGRRLAADVLDPQRNQLEIWILDAASGAGSKFVASSFTDMSPVWSPEGDRLVFASNRKTKGTQRDVWVKRLDGSPEEIFFDSPDDRTPEDWSADGRFLSMTAIPLNGKRNTQLWVAETGGTRKAGPFATEAENGASRFSPDGRYVAYGSNETGKFEVYVRPFPEGPGRWQISNAGGGSPLWSRDGKQLYYESLEGKVMVVPVSVTPTFRAGGPSVLFDLHTAANSIYAVSADGTKFLTGIGASGQIASPFSLVVNWTGLLPR